MRFALLEQPRAIKKLLDATIGLLPSIPDGEGKQALVTALKQFETVVAPTTITVEDAITVAEEQGIDLCATTAQRALEIFADQFEITDAIWMRLGNAVAQAEKQYPSAGYRADAAEYALVER